MSFSFSFFVSCHSQPTEANVPSLTACKVKGLSVENQMRAKTHDPLCLPSIKKPSKPLNFDDTPAIRYVISAFIRFHLMIISITSRMLSPVFSHLIWHHHRAEVKHSKERIKQRKSSLELSNTRATWTNTQPTQLTPTAKQILADAFYSYGCVCPCKTSL
jgi:hypothetical protein